MNNSVDMKEENYQAVMAGAAGSIAKYMIVVWILSALFFNLSIVGHTPDYSKLSRDIAQNILSMISFKLHESRVGSISKLVDLSRDQMSLCNFEQLHYPTIKDVKRASESCFEIINRQYRISNGVEGTIEDDESESGVGDFLGTLRTLIVSADTLNKVALRTGLTCSNRFTHPVKR